MAELAPWAYQRDEAIAYPSTLIKPPPVDITMPAGSFSTSALDAQIPGNGIEGEQL
jgi:hypothetical protein